VSKFDARAELPAHTPGCNRGEEQKAREGPEPGRDHPRFHRSARDSTSINAEACAPIDSAMPQLPPA
jgi:hypothetical protein